MTGNIFVSAVKSVCFCAIASFMFLTTFNAHAATVSYTLDNVVLVDGTQMTGAFDWTYNDGDFEGGEGVFTALEIPYRPGGTLPPLEDENMVLIIEFKQIEISLDGNFHDYGLDISLKYPLGLSPTRSASIDEAISSYECCGNDFKTQAFQSGGMISPVPLPAAAWLFMSALVGLVVAPRKKV